MLATDDIAFDLYQDMEVAKIIRRLENQKVEAVESLCPTYIYHIDKRI